MEEMWKCLGDIEGFDGYQYFISNKGRVKNDKGCLLTPTPRNKNCKYLRVSLTNKIKGKRKSFSVHRLVMIAFEYITNHEDMTVNHKDENPSNNKYENLEWMTSGENVRYSQANISYYGNVDDICSMASNCKSVGLSLNQTAEKLNIPTGTLYHILHKNNHQHLFKRKKLDVDRISNLLDNGYRGKKIAEMLSISESSVSNVRKLMKRDRIDESI